MDIRQILLWAFALSGMTALIYEVVWTRPLQYIFGSTIYAVSAMLTTFFIGFALGSYIFRNLADISNPIRLFMLLELGIGIYGLIILSLFSILPAIYLSFVLIPGVQFLQFVLIFLVLILPATFFGGIWPIVNKAYVNELGKDVGKLYSLNSLGAAFGSLATGFLLIPLIGIRNTSILAAFINLSIAIMVFVYLRRIK